MFMLIIVFSLIFLQLFIQYVILKKKIHKTSLRCFLNNSDSCKEPKSMYIIWMIHKGNRRIEEVCTLISMRYCIELYEREHLYMRQKYIYSSDIGTRILRTLLLIIWTSKILQCIKGKVNPIHFQWITCIKMFHFYQFANILEIRKNTW